MIGIIVSGLGRAQRPELSTTLDFPNNHFAISSQEEEGDGEKV